MPKGYSLRVRDDIEAGPESINLREFSYYYFEVGFRISELLNDENLMRVLRMALCGERFKILISRALSRCSESLNKTKYYIVKFLYTGLKCL